MPVLDQLNRSGQKIGQVTAQYGPGHFPIFDSPDRKTGDSYVDGGRAASVMPSHPALGAGGTPPIAYFFDAASLVPRFRAFVAGSVLGDFDAAVRFYQNSVVYYPTPFGGSVLYYPSYIRAMDNIGEVYLKWAEVLSKERNYAGAVEKCMEASFLFEQSGNFVAAQMALEKGLDYGLDVQHLMLDALHKKVEGLLFDGRPREAESLLRKGEWWINEILINKGLDDDQVADFRRRGAAFWDEGNRAVAASQVPGQRKIYMDPVKNRAAILASEMEGMSEFSRLAPAARMRLANNYCKAWARLPEAAQQLLVAKEPMKSPSGIPMWWIKAEQAKKGVADVAGKGGADTERKEDREVGSPFGMGVSKRKGAAFEVGKMPRGMR